MADDNSHAITEMTSEIVSAYVAGNTVATGDLAGLIRSVHSALSGLGEDAPAPATEETKLTPGQIRKSIKPEGLVSFINGRPYKALKRHLSKHGMTIADYKAKFNLPKDYPTTAADYSAKRSEMAKLLGLGRQKAAPPPPPPPPPPPVKAARKPRTPKAAA